MPDLLTLPDVRCKKPLYKPYFHRRKVGKRSVGGFLPSDVVKLYGLPRIAPQSPKTPVIAIIELGGGFKASDNAAAFQAMNLPAPSMGSASVQGATNSPGDDADGEVALDIQVAAGVYSAMTGQQARILMVWAPNTSQGFAQAISAAVQAQASVASISWGGPEASWDSTAAMESALASCVSAGIPVFVASGDNDASDGTTGKNVDYPASSPSSIGCGGTTVVSTSPLSERVWNDGSGDGSGGGYSAKFSRPAFQTFANPMRGVPDVAGVGDPDTGWKIYLDGQWGVIGGTSAVAPLWAGITAALVAGGMSARNLVQRLYANQGAFADVLVGDNSGFSAGPGWDACTGLGSPSAALLNALLGSAPIQPVPPPITVTNPPPKHQPPWWWPVWLWWPFSETLFMGPSFDLSKILQLVQDLQKVLQDVQALGTAQAGAGAHLAFARAGIPTDHLTLAQVLQFAQTILPFLQQILAALQQPAQTPAPMQAHFGGGAFLQLLPVLLPIIEQWLAGLKAGQAHARLAPRDQAQIDADMASVKAAFAQFQSDQSADAANATALTAAQSAKDASASAVAADQQALSKAVAQLFADVQAFYGAPAAAA